MLGATRWDDVERSGKYGGRFNRCLYQDTVWIGGQVGILFQIGDVSGILCIRPKEPVFLKRNRNLL